MGFERVNGAVPGLPLRNRFRSFDSRREEEKEMRSDDDEEEEEMWNGGKVKNKEEKKMWNGGNEVKNKEEKKLWHGYKMKNRKVATAFFEEEKKKKMLSSHNVEKKIQSGDHGKDKIRNTPLSLNNNKMQKNENKKRMAPTVCPAKVKKMRPSDSMEMRMHNCDSKGKRRRNAPSVPPKENKIQTSSNNKKENKRKEPPTSFKEKMRADDKDKKVRYTDKIHTLSNNKKENKRKEPPTPFKKEKKMWVDDKDKKVGNTDKGKGKTMQGDITKEKKVHKEEKRKAPLAFFKFICNNFKEFLLIPPTIAPKLEDLTNNLVYLKDSEGKSSKIRLSVVDGSLAFHHGWDNFASDHSIKWGDFLLFEYGGMSTFSVRVFGIDSCERLHFNVERQGGRKNKKESHMPLDDLVSSHRDRNSEDIDDRHYVSGEYPRSEEPKTTVDGYIMNNGKIAFCNLVAESMDTASETYRTTANTTENPSRVVSGVGRGPSAALDNEEGNLATGEYKTKSISPTCCKEKTRSEIILITDAAPLTQENYDTVKLTTLNVASETHHGTANTKEDPREVAGGSWCGPSVALDNEEGNLSIGESKTKNISPICSQEKTRSETILITAAAPLTQEYYDTVKLATFSHHKEDISMIRESETEVATPTKCTEIHDSDEDLRRKQERNTVQLECATVVDKCPNNGKMNTNGNICRKNEAPGYSRCLEKWKKGIVSGRAALDVSGMIRPEKTQKIDEKFIGNCGAMGLNPVEQQLGSDGTNACVQPMPDRISKSGHSRTEIDHSFNGKGAIVQLQTKEEQLEPVRSIVGRQRNNIPVCADRAVPCQSGHHFSQQEDGKSSNCVTSVALLPVKAEVLELDDHSLLEIDFQFCIPSTTQTWLELPKSLSNAVRRKGRQDRNIIMLKDPMRRLWPVFYHENPVFVGFTTGWKPFVAANNLQIGDLCELLKELDEEEPVYRVEITKKMREVLGVPSSVKQARYLYKCLRNQRTYFCSTTKRRPPTPCGV